MSTRQSPRRGGRRVPYVAMALLSVYVALPGFFVVSAEVTAVLIAPAHAADEAKQVEKDAAKAPALRKFTGTLPPAVVDMREAILAAVDMGDIAELKHAIELNELKPDFGDAAKDDPIAFWKAASADGEGREILAKLATLLALPPQKVALGRNPENTDVFVWPYLAELPLDTLKPGEIVDALRLVPQGTLGEMIAAKAWHDWRLVISADGTWISFKR